MLNITVKAVNTARLLFILISKSKAWDSKTQNYPQLK